MLKHPYKKISKHPLQNISGRSVFRNFSRGINCKLFYESKNLGVPLGQGGSNGCRPQGFIHK